MKALLLFIGVLLFNISNAQMYVGENSGISVVMKSANCAPPSSSTFMEMNNVKAIIHTGGNLWQIPGQNYSQYEVPKNSGIMALFTSALWLGGVDANNQLKLAALRYRSGQDYWTGPLSQGGAETTFENCVAYDKHYVTTQDAVREFNAWFEAGLADEISGTSTQADLFPEYEVPNMIKNWPAHGDISLGQDFYLAPFFDRDEDGVYDWQNGDYPWYDITKTKDCSADRSVSLYGDLNYWWVMNDKGNIHTETGADPIGMEIRAQAFSFASNDEINNMTFYNYELINRGTQTLFETYFGCFTDGALGDPYDDYVGCDVNRGLAYYYNGDNFDGDNSGYLGYGNSPPAVGVDFFEGPYQDDDGIDNAYGIGSGEALNGIGFGDTIIDNERYGMRRFLYYSNNTNGANPSQTDPESAADYYSYLQGYWKDGTRFYYGGSGHVSDSDADPNVPCDFMFPGDTDPLGWGTGGVPQPEWTEQTAGNPPNDRRFVQSAGPFILKPGAVNNITVGVVWARAAGGDPFASVEALKRADDKAQSLFENCFKVLDGPHAPLMEAQELENTVILTISNPVNSNNYLENYIERDPFIISEFTDRDYRFQGYQIYQLSGKDVPASELQDVSKARLVAQCDIEDDIDRVINFEFDDALGGSIPTERVDGANKGIRHSFEVTQDLFAQGDAQLVNFKRYYFVAIAYAYNNYKTYDPTDPNGLDGQKKNYIASRKAPVGEIKILEVIPHNPSPESDGTIQSVAYGSGPQIKRLDGHGNGGQVLELNAATTASIISEGYVDTPVYSNGNGPINVKVVDPLNVVDGYFECLFTDYNTTPTNSADTADWVINRYDKEGGSLLESISSSRSIAINNEQIIPEWGVSVQINQNNYYLPEGASGDAKERTTDFLSGTITYGDSSKRWLSAVPDGDGFNAFNWIRSGDYDPTNGTATVDDDDCTDATDPEYLAYTDPCNYPDVLNQDTDKNWASILEGGIAPHKLVGYESSYMPIAYDNYAGVGVARKLSSLSWLPSVDIVFTSDKSKWTRCPVIELGRESSLNVGGAAPGELRASPSVDKNGNSDGTGTGMGWFPGYAIDVESGARLYMAFGENSFLVSNNGADMLWNPTEDMMDNNGTPILGGMHAFYVFSFQNKAKNNFLQAQNYPAYIPSQAENNATNELYNDFQNIAANQTSAKKKVYSSISWVANPVLAASQELLSTDATIRLRVNKEYKNFSNPTNNTGGPNGGKPMYSWSTSDIATELGSADELTSALDLINVVPNPYYAYSQYERNRLDTRVKITNLPERCTV
ncbi:MAG: T9SS C-terminal target domain-containing protein, partial [Crocinitomicaceae bacterium]|nr:T9SS C-terminal target domain-containing protein [Crocinitomicaceae bacterium]